MDEFRQAFPEMYFSSSSSSPSSEVKRTRRLKKRYGSPSYGLNILETTHDYQGVPTQFHPLITRLSGVSSIRFLQHPNRNILIIGELHQSNPCKEQGFVPLSDLILPYLYRTPEIDFMLEINADGITLRHDYIMKDVAAKVADFALNRHMRGHLSSRVHWIDSFRSKPKTTEYTHPKAERFIELLGGIVTDECTEREEDLMYDLLMQLTTIVLKNRPETKRLSVKREKIARAIKKLYAAKDNVRPYLAELYSFAKFCIQIVLMTYRFEKCRKFKTHLYVNTFVDRYVKEPYPDELTLARLFFMIQRFTLDLYVCCRLLKNDGVWYRNVVIYLGQRHADSLHDIFKANGCTVRNFDLDFNPTCEDRPAR